MDKLAAALAKSVSIKIGQALSPTEMNQLIDELLHVNHQTTPQMVNQRLLR